MALGADGGLIVLRNDKEIYRWRHAHSLYRLNAAGAPQGEMIAIGNCGNGAFWSRSAVTFDGERYLVVMDWAGAGTGPNPATSPFQTEIHGWFVGADGKVADDPVKGFTIAADAGKSEMLPTVAGGPKGVSLVVYTEFRGADDMKLVARLVK